VLYSPPLQERERGAGSALSVSERAELCRSVVIHRIHISPPVDRPRQSFLLDFELRLEGPSPLLPQYVGPLKGHQGDEHV
jgi:hypothetical protein